MSTMRKSTPLYWVVTGMTALLASGCASLFGADTPPPAVYALNTSRDPAAAVPRARETYLNGAPVLIVSTPMAAAGFDSSRMIYTRAPYQLEWFARNQWVDTPARMLAPLLVSTLQDAGGFPAIILAGSGASGQLRLDTEIVRLQQEFAAPPSRVRFTLRVWLVDNLTRKVLAWREFDASVPAGSEDPQAGVAAANQAVQVVLKEVATFCNDASAKWQPSAEMVKGK